MNNYAQRLKQYEDYKSMYIRNGMSGEDLTQALRKLADKLKI